MFVWIYVLLIYVVDFGFGFVSVILGDLTFSLLADGNGLRIFNNNDNSNNIINNNNDNNKYTFNPFSEGLQDNTQSCHALWHTSANYGVYPNL